MKHLLYIVVLFVCQSISFGQSNYGPCSYHSSIERQKSINPKVDYDFERDEAALQEIIADLKTSKTTAESTYTIPIVLHVFHLGDDGKMGMEQALSGIEILNRDFNGLNDDWENIDPAFDAVKGTLDISFCLATIDPEGNPTTGLIYHETEAGLYNDTNLYQYAWDNHKYLNVYLPKYTGGAPSIFTGFATFPNIENVNNNEDGIHYSSIRWGYGEHSELEEGDDWASVGTHEVGHWLDVYHTFQNNCNDPGDQVADTPPTLGGTIILSDCDNFDFSCDFHTNGENFMSYNHGCKKMFTQGQIERMEAALQLPSRINIWSEENLVATGCREFFASSPQDLIAADIRVYPNPAKDRIVFNTSSLIGELSIYNAVGKFESKHTLEAKELSLAVNSLSNGIYYYSILGEENKLSGKFIVSH